MEGKEAGEGGGVQGKRRRVMLAIFESECSHHALEWAVEFLRDSIAAPGAPPLVLFTAQPVANQSYIPAATYGSAQVQGECNAPWTQSLLQQWSLEGPFSI